jgi:anti-sigma factor RsiW
VLHDVEGYKHREIAALLDIATGTSKRQLHRARMLDAATSIRGLIVHQEWTDRLSDYLDDELQADERAAVEAHLRTCEACTAVLGELKQVVARAAEVDARPPQADLWAGIAERIERGGTASQVVPFARREARRFTFTLPAARRAAALLIAFSGGIAWQAAERTARLTTGRRLFAALKGCATRRRMRQHPLQMWRRALALRQAAGPGTAPQISPASKR